jgi:hypothetical protein
MLCTLETTSVLAQKDDKLIASNEKADHSLQKKKPLGS